MVFSLGLLDIVKKRKPLGASMWGGVAYDYNRNLPSGHESRDVEALRRKFTTMKNCKKPTGYPTMPPEVRRAKRIFREIESEMSVVELDDDARRSENVDDPNDYSSEDVDEEPTQPTQASFLI
ncbi:hypothetical protein PsorP6_015758 [Peronosclerospora sorghi]|uniref:Uncharacterized protein n=1 Tax=Peronosclerospora sorghi TaxID=230839 RepID=A0ACC0WMT8_9STRA|nr:hypothetical protein PsorP6_015758 [Peronosclerospora sorghi]